MFPFTPSDLAHEFTQKMRKLLCECKESHFLFWIRKKKSGRDKFQLWMVIHKSNVAIQQFNVVKKIENSPKNIAFNEFCNQLRWTTKGLVSHSQIGWDELYSTNCKYWVSHKSRSWLLLAPTSCYQLDTNNPAATDTKMKHVQRDEMECKIYLPSYLTCSQNCQCKM